jgi:hypothetical protein
VTQTSTSTPDPTETPIITATPAVNEPEKKSNGLCVPFQNVAATVGQPDGQVDLYELSIVGNNPPQYGKNLSETLDGVVNNPDAKACKIVADFTATGATTSDLILFGLNGSYKILETPDLSEVDAIFYLNGLAYVVDGKIYTSDLDGQNATFKQDGTHPKASTRGQFAYTDVNGKIGVDGQSYSYSGIPITWLEHGLLFLNTDDNQQYVLNGDGTTTLVGGTDFAKNPTKHDISGLQNFGDSINLFLFGSPATDTATQGLQPTWWSLFGSDTGW